VAAEAGVGNDSIGVVERVALLPPPTPGRRLGQGCLQARLPIQYSWHLQWNLGTRVREVPELREGRKAIELGVIELLVGFLLLFSDLWWSCNTAGNSTHEM